MSKLTVDLALLKKLKDENPAYIRKVIASFRGYEKAEVVFGMLGTGRSPNYEITFPNGIKVPKNGNNHQPFHFSDDVPKEDRYFNPENVSQPFTLEVMKSL